MEGKIGWRHLSLIFGFFRCLPFRACLVNSSETWLFFLILTYSFSWWGSFVWLMKELAFLVSSITLAFYPCSLSLSKYFAHSSMITFLWLIMPTMKWTNSAVSCVDFLNWISVRDIQMQAVETWTLADKRNPNLTFRTLRKRTEARLVRYRLLQMLIS